MKILVIGSDGFIGKNIVELLRAKHEVYTASRMPQAADFYIDLLDKGTIAKALKTAAPQIIINSAGIVDNSETAMQNPVFTKNLLIEIKKSKLSLQRIIISGSAAEYGFVDTKNIPVNETVPLNATSGYGLSKLEEEKIALETSVNNDMPVIVARIFNPIGLGMHERFLIPKMIQQVAEVKAGKRRAIEVSRLDSKRDYIHVADVASAIKALVEGHPKELVYNVGSVVATSNGELINYILENSALTNPPQIMETQSEPEPLVAVQADIGRIHNEFGWLPIYTVEQTVKEIINASK